MTLGPPLARVEGGLLEGRTLAAGIVRFAGVPFAAPPVGANRWQHAQPVERWDGTLEATRFGPAPLQAQPPRGSLFFAANYAGPRELVMSEDCLYLNLWTPAHGSGPALPVMVFVHGGGNRFGWGSQHLYDGARLAARGAVVVTLNYRLGALGFLTHDELDREAPGGVGGNYGLGDIVAALGWVKRHVEHFGGDPDRVTAFGNSAGAAHLCRLMASPPARGLFGRVIAQSGAAFRSAPSLLGLTVAGRPDEIEAARRLQAQPLEQLRQLPGAALITGGLEPVVDNWLLEAEVEDVFAGGLQAPVPLLAGWNSDEGSLYARPADRDGFEQLLASTGGLGGLAEAYPSGDGADWRESWRRLTGDQLIVAPLLSWMRAHAASGAPVWGYSFEREPPLPDELLTRWPPADGLPRYGAFHTAELPYVWDNLAARQWAWQEGDAELARWVAQSWVDFAGAGDVTGGGGGSTGVSTGLSWPPRGVGWRPFVDAERGPLLCLGATRHTGTVAGWDGLRASIAAAEAARRETSSAASSPG